jgi:phospholipase/carboxylesterase
MVPIQLGEMMAGRLRDMNYPLEWHSYPMPHAVCPEEIGHISAWLSKRLA